MCCRQRAAWAAEAVLWEQRGPARMADSGPRTGLSSESKAAAEQVLLSAEVPAASVRVSPSEASAQTAATPEQERVSACPVVLSNAAAPELEPGRPPWDREYSWS